MRLRGKHEFSRMQRWTTSRRWKMRSDESQRQRAHTCGSLSMFFWEAVLGHKKVLSVAWRLGNGTKGARSLHVARLASCMVSHTCNFQRAPR